MTVTHQNRPPRVPKEKQTAKQKLGEVSVHLLIVYLVFAKKSHPLGRPKRYTAGKKKAKQASSEEESEEEEPEEEEDDDAPLASKKKSFPTVSCPLFLLQPITFT